MGTRLYFGRVAPIEAQKQQIDGGWSWRYKVRVFDKHTEDKVVLPDEELPWAQVLLPVTAGSGAANYAVSPMINQGDTVSIAYYDADEQMPIITGILPRTNSVSTADPTDGDAYIPHTGFTEGRPKAPSVDDNESNESSGPDSQPSPKMAKFSSAIGDTTVLANTCDPNEYKSMAINSEVNNLFNQIAEFTGNAQQTEAFISGAIDRIHSLVNPYVGQMFSGLFDALIPVLNAGLKALYKAVYAAVLAATGGNAVAARLAAEAALLALRPAILALQEAISLLAAQVVSNLFSRVNDLVRDTVENNDQFTTCVGTQFNGALVNSIIGEIDDKVGPLLNAVSKVLSGGFNAANQIRSGIDIVKDLAGGLLNADQDANKCRGTIKEYAFGVGPLSAAGDILEEILDAANTAAGLVSDGSKLVADLSGLATEEQKEFIETFGDFPFMSTDLGQDSELRNCSTDKPTTCFGPEIVIFGGKGYGASAKAIVGDYTATSDERTITDVQGGVVSIEVLDGGVEYTYPPYVEVRDNCGLGLGCVARSVVKNGKVVRIYIVKPGENYPSDDGRQLLGVGEVEIIEGGSGYGPGIYPDQYGGEYEVITGPGGVVIDIIPINIVQVPTAPIIQIPTYNPPLPPGSIVRDDNIIDINGNNIGPVTVGNGLVYKAILLPLPNAEALLSGDGIAPQFIKRVSQEEIQQIISCIEA